MQRYKVEAKLGEGGMGIVYRARDVQQDRLVALKFLLSDAEVDEVGLARFKREMDVLMALDHPNIIKVYDAGETDGKLYYSMEMLDAKDLQAIQKAAGPLPHEPVASVLTQILEALSYIHQRKLVHRDIKPANIMLEPGGRAVLMDFGLVRKVDGTMLTAEGKLLGTPRYFPPEYIRGGEGTPGGDVWSLGVSAYELLAGERPFLGSTLQELALAILKEEPPALSAKRPDVPASLANVVHRMLAKKPEERFATAQEVLTALKGAVAQKVVERSTELSRELLALPAATGSKTGLTRPGSRVTGRRRITSSVGTLSGSTAAPALAPPPSGKGKLIGAAVAGALLVAGGIAGWMTRGRGAPAAVTAAAPEGRITAEYEAPDRIAVTFDTPDASRWKVDCAGSAAEDAAPATHHRIVANADPVRAPERITISAPGRTLDLPPPMSPTDHVRGLENALVRVHADAKTTDRMFSDMTKHMPNWSVVRVVDANGDMHEREKGATPDVARKAAAADPQIATILDLYLKGMRENAEVGRHLDPVLKLAPALLMSERVPQSTRDALLGVLFRLDLFDALAEYIGRPPPFKVMDLMQGAVSYEYVDQGFFSPPVPAKIPGALEALYIPRRKMAGVNLHHRGENPFKNVDTTLISAAEPSLSFMDNEEQLLLRSVDAPGPGGRRLSLWLYGLSGQLYAYLIPEGYKNGIFVRLRRGEYHGLTHVTKTDVTLRGPLAAATQWTLELRRVFVPAGRSYFAITGVAAEPLPR